MDEKLILTLLCVILVTALLLFWYNSVTDDLTMDGDYERYQRLGPSKSVMESKSLLDFFPSAENDGRKVLWAHAVNNREKLIAALRSPEVMVLEADVSLSGPRGGGRQPIMAHPPDTSSDLPLHDFLAQSLQYDKGIKLDFKSTDVLQPALTVLHIFEAQITAPVLLNADILEGVPGPSRPVDPATFLRLCSQSFPWTMLSLGWTTSCAQVGGEVPKYTQAMVSRMVDVVGSFRSGDDDGGGDQPVMFPVRACMVTRSTTELHDLLRALPGTTLLVFSGEDDGVTIDQLRIIRASFSPEDVYYDLPSPLREEFIAMKD